MMTARRRTYCSVFGYGCELNFRVLPTHVDVKKHWFLSNEAKAEFEKNCSRKSKMKCIGVRGKAIWDHPLIPSASVKPIILKIRKFDRKYTAIKKEVANRRNSASVKSKSAEFKVKARRSVDVAACKCQKFELCRNPGREKGLP